MTAPCTGAASTRLLLLKADILCFSAHRFVLCYNPGPHGTGHMLNINVLAVLFGTKNRVFSEMCMYAGVYMYNIETMGKTSLHNPSMPQASAPMWTTPLNTVWLTALSQQCKATLAEKKHTHTTPNELSTNMIVCFWMDKLNKAHLYMYVLISLNELRRHFLCRLFCYNRDRTHRDLYLSGASCWSQRHQLLSNYRYSKKMSSLQQLD